MKLIVFGAILLLIFAVPPGEIEGQTPAGVRVETISLGGYCLRKTNLMRGEKRTLLFLQKRRRCHATFSRSEKTCIPYLRTVSRRFCSPCIRMKKVKWS